MAYKIQDIQKFTVMDREMYFLDSNAWILYLMAEQYGDEILKNDWNLHYVEFVRAIVHINSFKKGFVFKPKIVVTSLLLSELINTYLRLLLKEHIENLQTEEEKRSYTFKKFRDTLTYKEQHRNLVTSFQEMSDFLYFIDDEFNALNPLELLNNLTDKYDFNDFYYFNLLKNKNITVVTDDSDFKFEGIEIVTYRSTLLKLMK
jgi:hypothetical protein